ncbi:MAG: S8 family serine peptidase, partial [Gammaproteobacteria bacterium]|nr:S8 family serine peptidase [Gammaproteobacteria bacterium]
MKKIFCVISTAALTSILSLPTHAMLHAPGKAYHPIHYKPNVSYLQPTGLSPSQVQTAYGIKNIASQGEGQIIAIVDAYDHPSIEKDLGVFDNAFGLPACTSANGCFTKVYAEGYPPQTDAGWAGEIALDVEWAHAIAPKAKIILVEANDSSLDALFHAVQIATQNGANVVSMSWGGSEFSSETSFDKYFNVPNVTFVASSGDNGTGASYPAASPYVVGAGGTTLSLDNNGNYAGETAWSGSGGG